MEYIRKERHGKTIHIYQEALSSSPPKEKRKEKKKRAPWSSF
jgi:hypothetical protein